MNQSLRKCFVAFHITLACVVFLQSVVAAFKAFADTNVPNWHIFTLAILETIAVVLFVIPATLRLGGIILCFVFVIAFIIHGLIGEFQLTLLVYISATIFVVVHGAGYKSHHYRM